MVFSVSSLTSALALVAAASGALTRVTNFGSNPSGIEMYIDVPTNVAANAPIIVGLHGCHGSAAGYYRDTSSLVNTAKQRGAILIYPSSTHDLLCWDSGTSKSLTRDGGGDPQTVVQMVNYAITQYRASRSRVFIVGTSSGAMLGAVLAAEYPDVFAAASVYSGVAAGCLAVPDGTPPNPVDRCALGHINNTPQQWGDIVRGYYSSYRGSYPKMQIWHGTVDTTVVYQCFGENLEQWSNVHGVAFSRNVTSSPESGYTQIVYGDGSKLVGYSAVGVGHVVPLHATQTLSWFGI